MAIDFGSLPWDSRLGRALRWPLRWIPKGIPLPILQGPLRGKRWIVGSHTHGCWVGSYELPMQEAFAHCVKPGGVVYDVGAQAGFYTLLASHLVGPKGRVLAIEPVPSNLIHLRRHLLLNRIENVEVAEGAAGDSCGTVRMDPGTDAAEAHFSDQGSLEVPLFTLDDLRRRLDFPYPTAVKIDVEGAEHAVLQGARDILAKSHPMIFLSTHSASLQQECLDLLKTEGYSFRPIGPDRAGRSSEWLAEKT